MTKVVALDIGLVVASHGRHYTVETPEGERLTCHPRGKKSDCVVGDRVRWLPTGSDEGVIEHLEPRRNLLFRQDEWKTKSFAANLDQLLVLVAANPVFSESQLVRALIAAESAGIAARIVLNKADLPQFPAARERLAQVGEVSQALNSGRHTTTTTQWYWLDADRTTALIDSPGFQEFGLRQIKAADLASYMPDLRDRAHECRFYNCSHRHEPGCGVRAALERGEISRSRYRIYTELFQELG